MRPYYEHGGITIYHGDCREVLASQDLQERLTKEVALVTDPPYGTETFNGGYGRAHTTIANDTDLSAFDGMLGAWLAVPEQGSHWCLAFYDTRRRRDTEDALIARGYALVGEAVWDKGRPSLGYTVRYAHEGVLVARMGDLKPNTPLISVLRGHRTTEQMAGRHPHEKPSEVMGRLVEFALSPVGMVIDPFCGSGSTLVAAKDLGRQSIGIEIEERYCEIAAKRLSQEVLDFGAA